MNQLTTRGPHIVGFGIELWWLQLSAHDTAGLDFPLGFDLAKIAIGNSSLNSFVAFKFHFREAFESLTRSDPMKFGMAVLCQQGPKSCRSHQPGGRHGAGG